MSPLDRIAHLTQENRSMETAALRLADDFDKLTEENRQLSRSTDLLRSQLADARKQLEADSQTIAKLAKDKREILEQLFVALCFVEDCEHSEDYKPGIVTSRLKAIRETISRHA